MTETNAGGVVAPRPSGLLGLGYVLAGGLLVLFYYLIPGTGSGPNVEWKVAVYLLASSSSVGAVAFGILRNRPSRLLPWLLILLSQAVYASADFTYFIRHDLLGLTQYPSFSDVLYLGHYVPLVVAVVLFVRRRTPGRDRAAALDGAVIAITAGMVSWVFLVAPALAVSGESAMVRLASAAYPIMDVVMLVTATWLLIGTNRKPRALWLLGSALVLLFTTDTIYALQQLHDAYHPGNFLDGMWVAYYLLVGAVCLDPSMVAIDEPLSAQQRVPNIGRFFGVGLAAIAVPVVLLFEQGRSTSFIYPVLPVCTALLFGMVFLRMLGMLEEQRRLAITDLLTGLKNRRYFETRYSFDSSRAARSGQPLSLILLDIDHFKLVNDRYGHAAGDIVLREIADRLQGEVRTGDVVCRCGGEEFIVHLAGAGIEEAKRIGRRLTAAVAERPFTVARGVEVSVTVSAGVVGFPENVASPDELPAAADRALYAAKAAGRNRMVVGTSDPPAVVVRQAVLDPVLDYLVGLMDTVDLCQTPTEHGTAIARWAVTMANELWLDAAAQRRCDLAARLHDVGKVAVPLHILEKAGPLTSGEWESIQAHPTHGERLVAAAGLDDVAEIIGQHHERVDGNGYPRGLCEEEIRLEARIVSVCDTYASMRADRPYRPGLTEAEARARLLASRGSQLSAPLVDLFVRLLDAGLVGHLGRLDNAAPVHVLAGGVRPDGVSSPRPG